MIYATKYRIVNIALPVLVIAAFSLVGTKATHDMFAQSLPTPTLEISTEQPQYSVGQPVVATLSNISAEDAYVMNNCPNAPLNVTRLTSSGWVPVQAAASITKCAGEPRDYEIPADRSIRVYYSEWPTLFNVPGTYRIQADIEPSLQGPMTQFTVVH